MTAIRFAASLALAFAAVTSAHAAEPATTAPAATAAATTTTVATAPRTVDNNRYCLRDEITGSRILRTECNSRQGWSRLGVDVDALRAAAKR